MCLLWCVCVFVFLACVYLSVPCPYVSVYLRMCVSVCVFASRCLHLHTCCIQMSSIRWGKERENMPNGEPNIFSICVCAPERPTHTRLHAGAPTRTQLAVYMTVDFWEGGGKTHPCFVVSLSYLCIYSTLSPYGRKFLSTH